MGVAFVAGLVLSMGVRAAVALDVTSCGDVVPAGRIADLTGDLACAAGPTWPFAARGVRLEPGATLRMNGFAMSGDGTGVGIECTTGRCTIKGPGEVSGFWAGINCGGCRVVARDLAVRGNVEGVYVPLAGTLTAARLRASDNAQSGIWASFVDARDVEASRNGMYGVKANDRVRLRRLDAAANGGWGVSAGRSRSRLVGARVSGSDLAGDGFDVVASGSMRLVRTTCGKSAKIRYSGQEEYDVIGSFGCAGDRPVRVR